MCAYKLKRITKSIRIDLIKLIGNLKGSRYQSHLNYRCQVALIRLLFRSMIIKKIISRVINVTDIGLLLYLKIMKWRSRFKK